MQVPGREHNGLAGAEADVVEQEGTHHAGVGGVKLGQPDRPGVGGGEIRRRPCACRALRRMRYRSLWVVLCWRHVGGRPRQRPRRGRPALDRPGQQPGQDLADRLRRRSLNEPAGDRDEWIDAEPFEQDGAACGIAKAAQRFCLGQCTEHLGLRVGVPVAALGASRGTPRASSAANPSAACWRLGCTWSDNGETDGQDLKKERQPGSELPRPCPRQVSHWGPARSGPRGRRLRPGRGC
jgi:hypothetical protein